MSVSYTHLRFPWALFPAGLFLASRFSGRAVARLLKLPPFLAGSLLAGVPDPRFSPRLPAAGPRASFGDIFGSRYGSPAALALCTCGPLNSPCLLYTSFAGEGARATPTRKTLGVVDYVRRLEEVLIRTCGDFGIPARRVAGLTGVWTEAEPAAKLAAIGVHISRSVTSHGFALNVNTDLSYFNLIVPCGITAKPVTSMQKELGRELDLGEVCLLYTSRCV